MARRVNAVFVPCEDRVRNTAGQPQLLPCFTDAANARPLPTASDVIHESV